MHLNLNLYTYYFSFFAHYESFFWDQERAEVGTLKLISISHIINYTEIFVATGCKYNNVSRTVCVTSLISFNYIFI